MSKSNKVADFESVDQMLRIIRMVIKNAFEKVDQQSNLFMSLI